MITPVPQRFSRRSILSLVEHQAVGGRQDREKPCMQQRQMGVYRIGVAYTNTSATASVLTYTAPETSEFGVEDKEYYA